MSNIKKHLPVFIFKKKGAPRPSGVRPITYKFKWCNQCFKQDDSPKDKLE